MVKVWMDAWQLQCCGTEWSVGDLVDWTTSSRVDREFLRDVAGVEADGIRVVEEHHQDDLIDSRVVGRVFSIVAVSCRYAPREGESSTLYPVRGTTVLEPLSSVDRWHRAPAPALEFVGFTSLVEEDA